MTSASSDEASEVVDAHRALAAAGLSNFVWGHAGIRAVDGAGFWTKAAGWGFEEVEIAQALKLDFDGGVLHGSGAPHIEFHIHAEILRSRPDVRAVVHTHSEAAVAFASLEVPLRPLSHDAIPFLGPDVERFERTGDLIATSELGRSLAATLGGGNGLLIPGHGMVTVGSTVAVAVMHAAMLDRACRIQLDALAAGRIERWSSDEEVAHKQATLWTPTHLQAGYAYLVREAGRRSRG